MRLTSIAGALVLAVAATSVAPAQVLKLPVKVNPSGSLIIKSVNLQGLSLNNLTGLVTATGGTVTGTLAGLPFTTNIEDFALQLLPGGTGGVCSVLNLELAPISLSLLGLHVDTSPICLNITAIPGGGLLGDLLCGIAGGGLPLDLLGPFLGDLLGDLLTPATNPGQGGGGNGGGGGGDDSVCTGACEILDLVLGPVDLTLLGLNVLLDNCDEGAIEVCVSATASEGLLGNLLCSLTGPDLLNITLKDIAKIVKKATK